jgi:hypothetical protein
MQSGGTGTDGNRVLRPDIFREVCFELPGALPGGEPATAQHIDYRLDLFLTN